MGDDEKREKIFQAILNNRKVTGAHRVLRGDERGLQTDEEFAPPFLIGSAQRYRAGTSGEKDSLADFEDLSLAARLHCIPLALPDNPKPLPWERHVDKFEVIPGRVVVEAIAAAAAKFDLERDAPFDVDPAPAGEHSPSDKLLEIGRNRHRARRGLQIVGCAIDGDIDLVNARLPFSVRFVGCAIKGHIIADQCELVTLDLSGSVVDGIYATFLNAHGSVRMRRTVCTGPADFGGARVSGVFDASDSVMLPISNAPDTEAFVGDRGIFNLSLSNLENEVRLSRARIYGGISLRGCVVNRTVFMDDVILRSPVAVLEKAATDVILRAGQASALPASIRAHASAEADLAARIHPQGEGADRRRSIETLSGLSIINSGAPASSGAPPILQRLLAESIRARTCALRADGWIVKGSLFARGLRAGGRVRMKYARIGGGLHLDGARLRSVDSIRDGLDHFSNQHAHYPAIRTIEEVWRETRQHADRSEAPRDDDRALDLGHIVVDGDLDLCSDARKRDPGQEDGALVGELGMVPGASAARAANSQRMHGDRSPGAAVLSNTLVMGRISVVGGHISGSVRLNGLIANVFAKPARRDAGPPSGSAKPFLDAQRIEVGANMDFRSCIGIAGVDALGAKVRQDVLFANPPKFEADEWDPIVGRPASLTGEITFARAEIGGECILTFDREHGPNLRLAQSVIRGRLQILPAEGKMEWEQRRQQGQTESEAELELRKMREDLLKSGNRLYQPVGAIVDLRHLKTSGFGHPPTAWPKKGRLRIEGFEYVRARNHGPLSPLRVPFASVGENLEFNRAFRLKALLFAAMLLPWIGLLAVLIGDWRQTSGGLAATDALIAPILAVGPLNAALAVILVLTVWVKRYPLTRGTRPSLMQSRPLGELWLRLQHFRISGLRTNTVVVPLEPYLQASKALRTAGRMQSADWIEYRRMQARTSLLSWRHHFPAKIFLNGVDLFTMFGFGVARSAFIAAGFIVFGAMCFYQADQCGMMVPASDNILALPFTKAEGALPFGSADSEKDGLPAAHVRHSYPAFNSLAFAMDLFVPVLDFGQQSRWIPGVTNAPARKPHCIVPDVGLYTFLMYLLQVSGWMLATAIAVAVLTRAETVIARSAD